MRNDGVQKTIQTNAREYHQINNPLAAAKGFGDIKNPTDLITSKLPALHAYQLSLLAPRPPNGIFDPAAAARGQALFAAAGGKANCASCHVSPLFTEAGWNLHSPTEMGIDSFQANRSPDVSYRTAHGPLDAYKRRLLSRWTACHPS